MAIFLLDGMAMGLPGQSHPRFVSYHHLLGFFPRSPLLWRGLFPTVAAHCDPSEILSGLEAPLNHPVRAADARSHHPLSIQGRSLGIGMPGGEFLLLYWVAHLWWGGQGAGLSILVLLWSGVEHSGVACSTLPCQRGNELG